MTADDNSKTTGQTDRFTALLEVSHDGGTTWAPAGGHELDLLLEGVGQANRLLDDNGTTDFAPAKVDGDQFPCVTDTADDGSDGMAEGSCVVRVTSATGGAMTLFAALYLPEEQALCADCFVAAQLEPGDANGDDTIIWTVPGGGGNPCDEVEARHSSGSRSADSRGGGNGCDEEDEKPPSSLSLPRAPTPTPRSSSRTGRRTSPRPRPWSRTTRLRLTLRLPVPSSTPRPLRRNFPAPAVPTCPHRSGWRSSS